MPFSVLFHNLNLSKHVFFIKNFMICYCLLVVFTKESLIHFGFSLLNIKTYLHLHSRAKMQIKHFKNCKSSQFIFGKYEIPWAFLRLRVKSEIFEIENDKFIVFPSFSSLSQFLCCCFFSCFSYYFRNAKYSF